MTIPLDQLIYHLEQVIRQLEALEDVFTAFPVEAQNPPSGQQNLTEN